MGKLFCTYSELHISVKHVAIFRDVNYKVSMHEIHKMNLMSAIPKCYNIYKIYNRSVYNTTILFIYFKVVYCQSDMFRPSTGHL